jgi:hypothetical protein
MSILEKVKQFFTNLFADQDPPAIQKTVEPVIQAPVVEAPVEQAAPAKKPRAPRKPKQEWLHNDPAELRPDGIKPQNTEGKKRTRAKKVDNA